MGFVNLFNLFISLDQLREIGKYSYAQMICAGRIVNVLPTKSFEILSDTNPLVNCSALAEINLNLWSEKIQYPG